MVNLGKTVVNTALDLGLGALGIPVNPQEAVDQILGKQNPFDTVVSLLAQNGSFHVEVADRVASSHRQC